MLCEVLTVSDIPAKYQNTVTVEGGVTVQLTTQRTGFGQRRYFLCPSCGRKCAKLHRAVGSWGLYCQKCTPLNLYRIRQGLYDEAGTALIKWHMQKLANTVGIRNITYPFDLIDYLDKSPPQGMSWTRYVKGLEKLQRMEQLRIAAIFYDYRFTATEIKEFANEV